MDHNKGACRHLLPLFLIHFRHMYDGLEMSISYLKMGIILVINKVLNEGLRLI